MTSRRFSSTISLSSLLTGRKFSLLLHMFHWLPASEKRIKYLFVHHPYPFLDIDGKYPSIITETSQTSDESQSDDDMACLESSEVSHTGSDIEMNDLEDSDESYVESADFEGSLDSEEEKELLEDAEYLEDMRKSLILPETPIMDVMVAMKDSSELLSRLFGGCHSDADSNFYANTETRGGRLGDRGRNGGHPTERGGGEAS